MASSGMHAADAPLEPEGTQASKTVLTDRFDIGEELGRGAYGHVFKGTDRVTGQPVAIKLITLDSTSPEHLADVMGEIELLRGLSHDHIVQYLGSFRTRTHLYIILEFMEKGSLSGLIKQWGKLSEEIAAAYIKQVLQGLQYLHEQGIVHRDIKGANILMTGQVTSPTCMHARMQQRAHEAWAGRAPSSFRMGLPAVWACARGGSHASSLQAGALGTCEPRNCTAGGGTR